MISARVQIRVVAGVYALLGAVYVLWIASAWSMASSAPPGSVTHRAGEHLASAIPPMAALAIGCFALCGLSLRFQTLGLSWRITTISVSVILTLFVIWAAARASVIEIPVYLAIGPDSYSALAILLGFLWGLALLYSACSFLLWRQLRASNNRWRGP